MIRLLGLVGFMLAANMSCFVNAVAEASHLEDSHRATAHLEHHPAPSVPHSHETHAEQGTHGVPQASLALFKSSREPGGKSPSLIMSVVPQGPHRCLEGPPVGPVTLARIQDESRQPHFLGLESLSSAAQAPPALL